MGDGRFYAGRVLGKSEVRLVEASSEACADDGDNVSDGQWDLFVGQLRRSGPSPFALSVPYCRQSLLCGCFAA